MEGPLLTPQMAKGHQLGSITHTYQETLTQMGPIIPHHIMGLVAHLGLGTILVLDLTHQITKMVHLSQMKDTMNHLVIAWIILKTYLLMFLVQTMKNLNFLKAHK